MPRASLLSVFTGIGLKAVRTWRVSISSTARPAFAIPAWSHRDKGPASSPLRSRPTACLPNEVISASGSLSNLHFTHDAAIRIYHAHT